MGRQEHDETACPAPASSWLAYWWPVVALAAAALFSAALIGLAWRAQAGAHEYAVRAMRDFPGDEVEALLGVVQSERRAMNERNRAVNALGQIGDRRALPTLETFYPGHACQHDRFLCQKELRKAIDRCLGKNWAPAWLPFFPQAPGRRPGK